MTHVLLFHTVLGVTPGLTAFADDLRAGGHQVDVPDLFDGRTFTSIEAGIAHVESLDWPALQERGGRAADGLPTDLVYAGFSLGGMFAEQLALTRSGARGALLLESCAPPSAFDATWPDGVALQVHGKEQDPFFADEGDLDAARELVADVGGELFLYPGKEHLFADRSVPWYDAGSAALMTERVLAFLDGVRAGRDVDEQ
jgi:dienelactone hydrolase